MTTSKILAPLKEKKMLLVAYHVISCLTHILVSDIFMITIHRKRVSYTSAPFP